jgi:hypothetical protein
MSKQRQRGNATERAVARRLGGQRVGQYGGEDVSTEAFSIEAKARGSLPAWLTKAMAQAVGHCPEGKLPMVVLHVLGARHDNDMVIIRLSDFEQWYGGVTDGH